MKILYFFQEIETPMFQWQRTHFINELEHHGCYMTCFNPLKYATPIEANEQLISHLSDNSYDLFFTNVCYEKVLFPETVDYIKSRGVATLCLRCDNLIIPYNDKVLAPHFDLVWLTAVETRYLYDHWGVKSFFAPYAANPFVFVPNNSITLKRSVCFIGTPYGSRSLMINALSRNDVPVDVYYKKTGRPNNSEVKNELKSSLIWPSRASVLFHRLFFPQGRKVMLGTLVNKIKGEQKIDYNRFITSLPSVRPDQQGSIYSDYALALASTSTNHTDVLRKPLKIINLRNFEIPMSGGIEICKYNQELSNYFDDGKEIIFYKDNEELVDKAQFYLTKASDQELLKMKQSARKRAEKEHTWWKRFTIAFDLLGLKY